VTGIPAFAWVWAALLVAVPWQGGKRGGERAPLPQLNGANVPVRLAYFYKPPEDGTTSSFLARHVQLVILTQGDEAYRDELRRNGFPGMVLQSVAANETEGPGPYATADASCDLRFRAYQRTMADRDDTFCRQIHPHESWFLHNLRGERLYNTHRSGNGVLRVIYRMNPGDRGWRRFAAQKLLSYHRLDYDGIFLDDLALSRSGVLNEPENRGGLMEYGDDAAFRSAVIGYLTVVRKVLHGVPLWANLTSDPGSPGSWKTYLPFLEGVMVEDFVWGWRSYGLTASQREIQLENVRGALAKGRRVLVVAQGGRTQRARLVVALACYHVLDNGRLYFRYADAGDADYRNFWWYPQYSGALGMRNLPACRVPG